jgi:hypothetical protein
MHCRRWAPSPQMALAIARQVDAQAWAIEPGYLLLRCGACVRVLDGAAKQTVAAVSSAGLKYQGKSPRVPITARSDEMQSLPCWRLSRPEVRSLA